MTAPVWEWGSLADTVPHPELTRTLNRRLRDLSRVLRVTFDQTILDEQLGWYLVSKYGGVADDVTDIMPAFIAAVTAATSAGGGIVLMPPGPCFFASAVSLVGGLGSNVTIVGHGMGRTILKKGFNGTWFAATGISYFGMRDLTLDGNYETGVTGKGVVTTGSTNYHRYTNVFWKSIEDTHFEIGADAGEMLTMIGCQSIVGTGQALASVKTIHHNGQDTGARHRVVVGNVFNGCTVQFDGAFDTYFTGNGVSAVVTGSGVSVFFGTGNLLGGNAGTTLDGDNVVLVGNRFAGDVTLGSGMGGSCVFAGNIQTAGTFTDNSPIGACLVYHQPLSVNYALIERHKLMQGSTTGALIKTCRRISPGDANSTFDPLGGVSHIRYGTTLTANRTVTLTTTNAVLSIGCRVSRPAAGAFTVDVGGLISLDQGEWCDVEFNGSAYEVTAFGSDGTAGVEASIASTAIDLTLTAAHHTVLVDASGANRTITLPAAASHTKRIYHIKKIDSSANTVTIDGNAAETIDGAATLVLTTQWQAASIQSNGTAWFVL